MGTLNAGTLHREQIGAADAGRTVVEQLALRHGRASLAEWEARAAAGEILLDGQPTAALVRLRAGQCLAWARPPWEEPEVPLATAVLFEDSAVLAVAKPSGLPTLPGGGLFQDHTLLTLVRRRAPEASPMHRLGRFTSGLVLFARTAAAAGPLQAAFQRAGTQKTYLALCQGHPAEDAFEIAAPIGEVPYAPLGSLHAASPTGRASLSRVRVLERREGASLLEVEIATGRPHQIRIHLAFVGHPLVGDPLYGAGGTPLPGTCALPGDGGYRLHAWKLDLEHPTTGQRLTLSCHPPPVLRPGVRS